MTFNTDKKTSLSLLPKLVAIAIATTATPIVAADRDDCTLRSGVIGQDCDHANAGTVVSRVTQPNVEPVTNQNLGGFGFSISVDDPNNAGTRRTIAGAKAVQSQKRIQDQFLDTSLIQVTFDGLGAEPRLNVDVQSLQRAFTRGSTVRFGTFANYPVWISRAEIIITDPSQRNAVIQVLPVTVNGQTDWSIPQNGSSKLGYALRVYDAQGRYDETYRQDLTITDAQGVTGGAANTTSFVQQTDRTKSRAIPVRGGVVNVSAQSLPAGSRISALGADARMDRGGDFVIDRILPPGLHRVAVHVIDPQGRAHVLNRDIDIPEHDTFATGIVDLTFGRDLVEKENYSKGRVSGFVTGVTAGGTKYTASIDTGEDELDQLFKGLDRKNPKNVLDQVKATDVYVTMGDDSTTQNQAPTSGKIYAKVENNNSFAMIGDFKPTAETNSLVKTDRDVFGVQAQIGTDAETQDGHARARIAGFAAEPDTLVHRDVLRGTGGRSYSLSHRGINGGSQSVAIQIVDATSGRVINTLPLVEGTDYAINAYQGMVTLTEALAPTVNFDGGLISANPLGDQIANLVVTYEYTPITAQASTLNYGLRGEAWINENLRVGVSEQRVTTGLQTLDSRGIDVFARADDQTWINIEAAQSRGQGYDNSTSLNGGYEIDAATPAGGSSDYAQAIDITAQMDLARIGANGTASAYYQTRDQGFVSADYDTKIGQRTYGVAADLVTDNATTVRLSYDHFDNADGAKTDTLGIGVQRQLNDTDHLDVEVQGERVTTPNSTADDSNGNRTNVAVKYTRRWNDSDEIWVLAQGTLAQTGNMTRKGRLTVGGSRSLDDQNTVSGQISTDRAAELTWSRRIDDSTTYTLGYRLNPADSTVANGTNRGTLVAGATSQVNEKWQYTAENTYSAFSNKPTYGSNYGVSFTPNETWRHDAGLIFGSSKSVVDGTSVERMGFSWASTYANGDTERAGLRLEYSRDTSTDTAAVNDRKNYAVSAYWDRRVDPDWRWIANFDAVVSQSDQTSFRDGKYAELTFGYAYRPVNNDRTNGLISLTGLYDMPGADQVNRDGNINGAKQQSLILNAAVNHDLTDTVTIGAKYGYRVRKMAARDSETFTQSRTHLGILRLDYHVVHNWDLMAEGRINRFVETGVNEYGANLGVYRHFGNSLKAGVGYSWGKVSDDLRTIEGERKGVYLNLVGKF